MANGRTPRPNRGGGAGRMAGGFIALPWSVLDCPSFTNLSHPARSLLLEIARQYVRDNNGRLLASGAYLATRGWKSQDVITRAKRELIEAGFIHETVMGHRPNKASWYAITWQTLDKLDGYDPGRAEAQLVAEALETPPVMNDGGQVFAADHKNVVASALDAASLGVAMGYLRMQLTPSGTTAGLRARHLIVAADLEMLAMSLVLDIGADIDVSVVAELPNGRWYLTADHQIHPTIVTTRLKGSMLPVRLEGAKCPDGADGVGIRVMADIGAAIIRRDGIIRGGV